jgi:hypothetical protein
MPLFYDNIYIKRVRERERRFLMWRLLRREREIQSGRKKKGKKAATYAFAFGSLTYVYVECGSINIRSYVVPGKKAQPTTNTAT